MLCLIIGGLVGCFAFTFATVVDAEELEASMLALGLYVRTRSASVETCPGGGCFQTTIPDTGLWYGRCI